jgi:hypothetical protein
MPWTAKDASKKNHKVKSAKRKRQWAKVANSILARTGDDAAAVRGANAAVKKSTKKKSANRKKTVVKR